MTTETARGQRGGKQSAIAVTAGALEQRAEEDTPQRYGCGLDSQL